MLQHFFDIIPSSQSTFDGSIQCFPRNLGVPFLLQWPLQVFIVMFIC
jgi:hypothetical protein